MVTRFAEHTGEPVPVRPLANTADALKPPRLFKVFRTYVELTEGEAWRLWHALCGATWSTSGAWREMLIGFGNDAAHSPESVDHFFRTTMTPVVIIAAIEDLRKEERLSCHAAGLVEEKVLARVKANGDWQP
jgi:hypothetical protein